MAKKDLPNSWDPEQTRKTLAFISSVSFIVAVCVLAANIFSLPFPFVRRLWMPEYWGFYGILNGFLFFWIAQSIRNISLPAVLCGFGLILFEQLLLWQGFYYLFTAHRINREILSFTAFSFFLCVILAVLWFSALNGICHYYSFKKKMGFYKQQPEKISAKKKARLAAAYGIAYFLLFLIVFKAVSPDPEFSFSVLRLLGILGCTLSLYGIGQIIAHAVQKGEPALTHKLGILLHSILLTFLLCGIESLLPVKQIMHIS